VSRCESTFASLGSGPVERAAQAEGRGDWDLEKQRPCMESRVESKAAVGGQAWGKHFRVKTEPRQLVRTRAKVEAGKFVGSQNKEPQTRWLMLTAVYSHIVVGARSLQSRCCRALLLVEALAGDPS
jgi:hypothetical protein